MKGEKFNIPNSKITVLVAPLDWGLGHATRCIPIIFELVKQNCEVIIAADGHGKILLQKEFPALQFVELKGYNISYSRHKFWLPIKLLLQLPNILFRIYAERRWLKKNVVQYNIDVVISDNRPGLSHLKIPCIYITHQLKIKTGNSFTEKIAQKMHYHFINKFSTCWVPDAAGEINLAGELSHPKILPKSQVTYLGPLSRFEKNEQALKYDLCIILSGPEPQRTVFESLITKDLHLFTGRVIFVRGLPGNNLKSKPGNASVEIYNHVSANELNHAMAQSKIIICRSGYTSVMDLVKLQKKAILVPTPGQTEQEYLAGYLIDEQLFYTVEQQHFSLQKVLKAAEDFNVSTADVNFTTYRQVIENFIKQLNENQ